MKRDLSINHAMPPQDVSTDVLLEKYCKSGETSIDQLRVRVANALASVETDSHAWAARFYDAQANGFVPAGRINSAAGTDIQATLINCFVQPVGDAIKDDQGGFPGIYTALTEAAETMRRGGGVGYDFSRIRPMGARVKGTHSRASGPVSYMRVFDRSCETVESAGSRRGAQMGGMRCDHPDIEMFITSKDGGDLKNFNISIAVTDEFVQAAIDGRDIQLVHEAAPDPDVYPNAFQRDDGKWVYKTVSAKDLWEKVMSSTYDHAEPGILFLDTANRENNLRYCETLETCNPCAEEWLPPYGCCCLGSVNLTMFVRDPFTEGAAFDFDGFGANVATAVRMLDNVLDVTFWPLEQQRREAANKRRIGLGFLGLGSALIMLGLRYDSDEGRAMAARISEAMRDHSYLASVELAKEKGAFPLFNADLYLQSGFAMRLPAHIRDAIRTHGIRNSHLNAIAPTGTITLAFADNASNGIEPAFSWTYTRKKRMPDGSHKEYEVADHAYRLYRQMGHDVSQLPHQFVTALEMKAIDHMLMLKVVQPSIDTSISKTVNVPADYPYDEFKGLYVEAWKAGLKGLATYRPNAVLGSVLSVTPAAPVQGVKNVEPSDQEDPDRRVRLDAVPDVTSRLAYPSRPVFEDGNASWSYMMEVPGVIDAGLFIGEDNDGVPFEAWVNGVDQPRGLGAIAKIFSIDMRAGDRKWTQFKLQKLMKVEDPRGFDAKMPGAPGLRYVDGIVPYFAKLVNYRCQKLGAFDNLEGMPTPLMDSLLFHKEPKSRGGGTISWTWDVRNDRAGDDFALFLKEMELPDGTVRPYSVWLSGNYPRALDGLCKLLSVDMWVHDPAWIGLKLRKLLNYSEPELDFMHWVPGNGKQMHYKSTVAYFAHAILYRFTMLGLLDSEGQAIRGGLVSAVTPKGGNAPVIQGKVCPECGAHAYIKLDGCERCTACGHVGTCG